MLLITTVLLAATTVGIVVASRLRHLHRAALACGALASLALFVILNLSDWPLGFLADFWLEHPIIGASAGALLIASVVYFAFEAHDRQVQTELDTKTAAVARTGSVDHLIDFDLGLSLSFEEHSKVTEQWSCLLTADRPFRWRIADARHALERTADGALNSLDPRTSAALMELSIAFGRSPWPISACDDW